MGSWNSALVLQKPLPLTFSATLPSSGLFKTLLGVTFVAALPPNPCGRALLEAVQATLLDLCTTRPLAASRIDGYSWSLDQVAD